MNFYRPSLRTALAILVLFAWLGSLGWLSARQLGRDENATLSAAGRLRLAPHAAWYGVFSGSEQVGSAGITLDTVSPGYRIEESITLETPSDTGLVRVTRRSETWLGVSLEVNRLHSRLSGNGRQVDWQVETSGDSLIAHSLSNGAKGFGRARVDLTATSSAALSYRLALVGALGTHRPRPVTLLDGWPLGGRTMDIVVGRDSMFTFADSSVRNPATRDWTVARLDTVQAFEVVVDGVRGPYRVWIDGRGSVIAMERLLGVRWVRSDFDLSTTEFRLGLHARAAAIQAAYPTVRRLIAAMPMASPALDVRRFVVRHRDGTRIDPALLKLLGGGRQEVLGDTITIHAVPASGGRPDVTVDPMIQSGAGAIQTVAARVAGHGGDDIGALLTAVHQLARVDTSPAAPDDALGSLAAHRGTPDGVTRLFVALAQAAGYRARYVVGVMPRGDVLLTHAWAEVWTGTDNGWIGVDPVNGGRPASTALIRLGYGGSSLPDEMLPMIANVRFTELGGMEKP